MFPPLHFKMSYLRQNSSLFLPSTLLISPCCRKIEFLLVELNLHLSILVIYVSSRILPYSFSLFHFLSLLFLLAPLSLPINMLRSPNSKDRATGKFEIIFPPKTWLKPSFLPFFHLDLKSGKILDFYFFFLQLGSRYPYSFIDFASVPEEEAILSRDGHNNVSHPPCPS